MWFSISSEYVNPELQYYFPYIPLNRRHGKCRKRPSFQLYYNFYATVILLCLFCLILDHLALAVLLLEQRVFAKLYCFLYYCFFFLGCDSLLPIRDHLMLKKQAVN